MGEVLIVYELDKAVTTRDSPRVPRGTDRAVRRVHAAPAAPGTPTATGPRTLCGKDTFAMETPSWKPSEHSEGPWYPEEYASAVCPDCDAVMET
ncbi:hypothetical protein OHB53_07960 [Streptomyces sp. NBC_00056]|uniref:hypothetical protein n=1 Tax=unclassified Streptomyces TaxID=2593676 RepID=UPI00225A02F0|nr:MULTISPECIES: hypothetical protein [unclassified Streptomyces]MCX5441446.1 hypothetical protein [Streptomyces sp. NBC_00063]WSE18692.1 hypothetical protein OG518_38235 [Streptomyces sp. NBC_01397]WUB92262.1 hypothetical protein OHO83_07925 [Streptomyces sp. NBC_00569]